MSEYEHEITLRLTEATTEQLQAALAEALEYARKCEAQGSWWHTWGSRADAIRAVLNARCGGGPG